MKRIFNIKTTENLEKEVKVSGWVHSKRSHGKILKTKAKTGKEKGKNKYSRKDKVCKRPWKISVRRPAGFHGNHPADALF